MSDIPEGLRCGKSPGGAFRFQGLLCVQRHFMNEKMRMEYKRWDVRWELGMGCGIPPEQGNDSNWVHIPARLRGSERREGGEGILPVGHLTRTPPCFPPF